MKEKPEQDVDLFHQALNGVTPLVPSNRFTPTNKSRTTPVRTTTTSTVIADKLTDHGAGDVAVTEFLRPGLNRMSLRKLHRGDWLPQDQLDLHGHNLDQARRSLVEFLHGATQRGLRCVEVIHGKGWRSEGRDGIMKAHTRHWLTQHAQVLVFCEAPLNSGGAGAVWVLLKIGGTRNARRET